LSPAVNASYFYASTQNVGVTLYSYPQLSQLGSVSDPNAAAMCSDKDGNVYVAESGASELTEYQAGTLTVMRTIDDKLQSRFLRDQSEEWRPRRRELWGHG
jgi:hypothetical protein